MSETVEYVKVRVDGNITMELDADVRITFPIHSTTMISRILNGDDWKLVKATLEHAAYNAAKEAYQRVKGIAEGINE